MRYLLPLLVACSAPSHEASKPTPTKPVADASTWPMPAGWRGEVIPFPLEFAPALAHTGYEDLRFPPGFFKPESPQYWSYAFIWRTQDAAALDAAALGAELTVYFRGLIAAVDDKHRITDRDAIVARSEPDGARFTLSAHVFDAFKTAQPVDLVGWAERRTCTKGALWIFVLARADTTIRAQLDELAASARCD